MNTTGIHWYNASEVDKIESYQTALLELPGPIFITGHYNKARGLWVTITADNDWQSLDGVVIKRFAYFPFFTAED